jgi:hypothetical protein
MIAKILHVLIAKSFMPSHREYDSFIICFIFAFQIKHMMAFIEQEAKEKAEEIDAKVRLKSNLI